MLSNRLIMGASSADGMDGLAIHEVDDGDDLEGHFRSGPAKSGRTILVHEWVTGGGLVGSPLPASWAAEGRAMRRAIAADFARLPGRPARVIVTSDARLADDPGPWTINADRMRRRRGPVAESGAGGRFYRVDRTRDEWNPGEPDPRLRAGGRKIAGLDGRCGRADGRQGPPGRCGCRQLSIDTPPTRTIVPGAGLPGDAPYPAVLKPVDGAGSVDTFYVPDARSLPDACPRDADRAYSSRSCPERR